MRQATACFCWAVTIRNSCVVQPICAPADVPLPVYDVLVQDSRLLVSKRPRPG